MYKETKKGLNYIPKKYHKYGKKLQSLESKKLLKYIAQDYKIELEPGISLKFFLIYKLTKEEGRALKEFIQENLRKGYIRLLQLLAGYSVLFVPKKNSKLRLYINYRQLNSITRKDRYPLYYGRFKYNITTTWRKVEKSQLVNTSTVQYRASGTI